MTASTLRQPMPRPQSYAEYERARPHMIDTAGRPLELAWCRPCNREHFTVEPHAADVPCPRCKATAGRSTRPSGGIRGSVSTAASVPTKSTASIV